METQATPQISDTALLILDFQVGVGDQPYAKGAAQRAAVASAPQYGYSSKQQIQLERKEDMKARGLASPDLGDCLAMSFAVTVKPRELPRYDPEAERVERLLRNGQGRWL